MGRSNRRLCLNAGKLTRPIGHLTKPRKMIIKVIFKIEDDGNPLAVFPEESHGETYRGSDGLPYITCYAHLGQHSAACQTYCESLPDATPEQYAQLERELTNLVGYDLEILNEETLEKEKESS